MEHRVNGQEQLEHEQSPLKQQSDLSLQSLDSQPRQVQQEQLYRSPRRQESNVDSPHKYQEGKSFSNSGMQQLVRRRTLQSPKSSGWVQSPPGKDLTSHTDSRPSKVPTRLPSIVSTEPFSNGSTAATLPEAEAVDSSGKHSNSLERPRKAVAPVTTPAVITGNRDGGNSSGADSCAPWRLTLIVEAFDAGATGCPACLPSIAAAQHDEEAAAVGPSAATAHADGSIRPGSSPGLRSRRNSSGNLSVSSTSSAVSDPSPRATTSSSSSKPDVSCCTCTQFWLEVQDLRGPGCPLELRLLTDSLLLPRFLSPPILLPRRMRHLEFRLYRRRPQQQQLLMRPQKVEWAEEREPLGIRAVSLPDAPSCVLSCTFGQSTGRPRPLVGMHAHKCISRGTEKAKHTDSYNREGQPGVAIIYLCLCTSASRIRCS